MAITLTPETQRLIEERMHANGASSPDELVRLALAALDQRQGIDFDNLDPDTRTAIDEAEAQYQRGEGIPLDDAFGKLRRNQLGE